MRRREASRYQATEVVHLVYHFLSQGRRIALDFRKYPGPPSVGPEGYQSMTPIPATIYLCAASPLARIERSGFDAEERPWNRTILTAWLAMPYFERLSYVDTTGFKVTVARRSQISGVKKLARKPAHPHHRRSSPPNEISGFVVVGGAVAVIALLVWLGLRRS